MSAVEVSRRDFLLGAAIAAALAGNADARPFPRGGHPVASAVPSYTLTFANTAVSDTPADIPIRAPQWFAPGHVPTSKIAVPTFGGVIDLAYQADARVYWGDGSLRGAVFRIARSGAISAGGTVQFLWSIRAGSYSNTSSITTADVTGETDFRVSLSNVHTAAVNVGNQRMMALTISGGQVSGGRVIYPANMTQASTAVSGGGGSGAMVSVSGGVITVDNPGSGYANTGGGTVTVSLNSIIAAVNSGGNRANGVRIEQYAKGPVCDAWRVSTIVSGFNHLHAHFYVERWKKADGSLLTYRLMPMMGNGLVDLVNSWPCYTYDLDVKNGGTVIRGTSLGDTGYTTILHTPGSAFLAADTAGQPYWTSNGAAYNAAIPQRTPTECLVLRATGVVLPWLLLNTTTAVPTTPAAYSLSANGGGDVLCQFAPMGNAGIRSALGSGGAGWDENPMGGLDGEYFSALYNARTSDARVWLNNIRVAAANSLTFGQLGSPLLEPTTLYLPNVVPASAQAFSGMTPTRETRAVSDITVTGFANPMPTGGSLGTVGSVFGSTYHQTCAAYGAYLVEGEQWQSDILVFAAAGGKFGKTPASNRQATLGTTTYYGAQCNYSYNVRVPAWARRTEIYAIAVRPDSWADGTADVEKANVAYSLKSGLDYLNALVSFTGSVKIGSSGATITKSVDFTGSGIWPENYSTSVSGGANEFEVPFMNSYELLVDAHGAYLLQGTAAGTALAAWRDYRRILFVRAFQDAGSHYLKMPYRWVVLQGRPPAAPVSNTYGQIDPANPTQSLWITPFGLSDMSLPVYLSFTSGSANIAASNGGTKFRSGVAVADGTRIRLTTTDPVAGSAGNAPPSPFDQTTSYYLRNAAGPGTIQLCTGLDGGGNPDPATAVVAGGTQATVPFVLIPANAQPADTSGAGWYESTASSGFTVDPYNRICQFLGTVRLLKAMGTPDDSTANQTAAIANLKKIFDATGQSYAAGLQYGMDETLAA